MQIVDEARNFARRAHLGQKDDEGKDYFEAHVQVVAKIVEACGGDEVMIAAAYLHDVVEDTEVGIDSIEATFGVDVAEMVYELTQEGKKDHYGYYFPRLRSRRAIIIKLADRMSNLMRMTCWPEKRQKQYLRKTKFWGYGSEVAK